MSLLRLHRILKEHRGPLRADFRREYGIDLDAVLAANTPHRIPARVLLDLIDGLSPKAAYWRSAYPEHAHWGLTEHLQAQLIDELRLLKYGLAGGKGRKPQRVPRPGVDDGGDDVQVIGAGEGFDSIDEFEAWYQNRKSAKRFVAKTAR